MTSGASEPSRPEPVARGDGHPAVLFSVPFSSPMGEREWHRLAGELGLFTTFTPSPTGRGASPGVARLDFFSGLFLVRGDADGEWRLECRSTRPPAEDVVRRWHLLAASGARELDPSVELPPRLPTPGSGGESQRRLRRRRHEGVPV